MQSWTIIKGCYNQIYSEFKECLERCLTLVVLLILALFGIRWLYFSYLSQFSAEEYNQRITNILLISYSFYVVWTFLELWQSCIRYCDHLDLEDEIQSINRVEDNNNYMLVGLSFVFGWIARQSDEIRLPKGGIILIILAILYAVLGFLFYPPLPGMRLSGGVTPIWWIVFLRGIKSLFGATSLMLSMLVLLNIWPYHIFKYS